MSWLPRRRREGRRPGERAGATGPSRGPGPADDGEGGDSLRAAAGNTGAATASGGSIANAGVLRIGQLVQQKAPRRPALWPHLVGTPPGQALGFQERAESSRLRTALEAEGTAVVGQVLSGLGGVGKTQLAAGYARAAFASGRLDVLVWVTAASRQAVIDGYARAAVELLGAEPDEDSAGRFLAWLQPSAPRAACRWLVVLDDLADPADLTALWPPQCASGRTVVTTRRRDAALTGPGRRRVDVGVFTPAEAEAALHQVLAERGHPAQPPGQVEALAAELGFLPLALSQAAAYITDAGLDCAAYRTLLADRARSLAGLLPRPAQGQEAGDTLVIYKPDIAALAGQVRRRRIGEWELEHPEQGRRYRDARRLVKSTFLFAGSSAAYPNCGLGLKEPGVNSLQTDQLFASAGRVGCIIPTAIATGAGGQHVFGEFARRGAVASLYDFENGNPIFPAVHASYSFACCRLPARGGASQPPVFRNRRDADLTVAIRGRIPGALAREGSGRQPVGYPAQATDPKHQERQGRQGTRR